VRSNGGFTETAPFVGIADSGFGNGSGPVGTKVRFPRIVLQYTAGAIIHIIEMVRLGLGPAHVPALFEAVLRE
jgi:hypothetical protein